jgi:alkylation response protein AidB-like acyl-CoA dehydrogenase
VGLLAFCLAAEEIGKVCAATNMIFMGQGLGTMPIFLGGDQEQKARFLPKLATGEHLAAFALTEANAGSDASAIKTKALKTGNDYVLNGSKIFITSGDVADIVCVAVKTDTQVPPHRGISVFVVEKGTPGFTSGKHENKMGVRASSTVELNFEDVRVPAENLLAQEGAGFSIVMKTLDFTRIPVAAHAIGIGQAAFDYAVQFTKERTQFGKTLFSFQGLQWMMADMVTQLEAARLVTHKAAAIFEEVPKNLERVSREQSRYSAMAKLIAAETAMKVTTDAVQLLGGYGYIKEYPVERMMRDAKITQIYEGTSQIQKIVIANTL